jgi:phage FluMu gp28-like protein
MTTIDTINIKDIIDVIAERDFLEYQLRWLRDESRFKIGLWARQTGKDYTCAAEAVFDCLLTPKTHWLILACGERQARESLEKARDWSRTFSTLNLNPNLNLPPSASSALFPSSLPRLTRESSTELRFSNGSRITALPAKPGTIRGYSANLILTEFAFHDDPESIWKAIFPSVSNGLRGGPKKLRIISTPNGQGNFFHELWTSSKIFERHFVNIQKAKDDGLPIDIAALRDGLADSEAWAQEYQCEFADQSSVLLPYELIEQCEAPEATQTNTIDTLTGELYLGIDFGRKQDLTVCWVLEKLPPNSPAPIHNSKFLIHNSTSSPSVLSVPRSSLSSVSLPSFITREVLVLSRTPTPAQIELLRPRVQRARRVCLDYTGAGIGLGDALAQEFGAARDPKDWRGKVELCTFTAPLKEEIFVKMRAAFERRSIWIPKSTDIREDLHSMHRVVSNSGHISFRASRTADGHSDRCTALALALRAADSAPPFACAKSIGRKRPGLVRRPIYY